MKTGARIMIIGCMQGDNQNREEFEAMAKLLLSKEYFPVIPQALFDGMDVRSIDEETWLKRVAAELLQCDSVVTLKDWECMRVNKKLVSLAHDYNLPVELFTKYFTKPISEL